MQREGDLLMRRFSRGFGVMTAMIILVIVATLGALMLSFSSSSVKQAGDDYLRLQAQLLAQSAQEFALLRISGFNRGGGGCLENLDIKADPFDINVTIYYIFDSPAPAGCTQVLNTSLIDHDSNGTAIIDVVVTTASNSVGQDYTTEPITVHRRTIQKP